MPSKKKHAQWWQVYAMVPVLAGLFLLEMRLPLTSTEHIIAQLGLLLLVYGFIHMWMDANRRALMELDDEAGEWQFKVYEIRPAQVVTAHEVDKPIIQLPEAGLKGVLSTTFEMDSLEEQSALPADSEIFYADRLFNRKDTTSAARGQADTKV